MLRSLESVLKCKVNLCGKGNKLTNGTEFCVVFTHTFDGVYLYFDTLLWSEFGEDNIRVDRAGLRSKCVILFLLAALGFPHKMGGFEFVVNVQVVWIVGFFWGAWFPLTCHVEHEHNSVLIRRCLGYNGEESASELRGSSGTNTDDCRAF